MTILFTIGLLCSFDENQTTENTINPSHSSEMRQNRNSFCTNVFRVFIPVQCWDPFTAIILYLLQGLLWHFLNWQFVLDLDRNLGISRWFFFSLKFVVFVHWTITLISKLTLIILILNKTFFINLPERICFIFFMWYLSKLLKFSTQLLDSFKLSKAHWHFIEIYIKL